MTAFTVFDTIESKESLRQLCKSVYASLNPEGEFIGIVNVTNMMNFEQYKKYGMHMITQGE